MNDAERERKRREEEDGISHAIHGISPTILGGHQAKGVEIIGNKGPIHTDEVNKGVEIITPRHGHKDSRRSGD
jgi:hypothetical protein